MKLQRELIMVGLIALSFGCKQPPPGATDASSKSLDNFVGETLTTNVCKGSQGNEATRAQLVTEEAYRPTIESAMSSVPRALQSAFFKDLKGRYILTDDIAGDCKSTDPALISCWQNVGGVPTIFIKRETKAADAARNVAATNENINHATLRAFAYFLSEFLVKLDPKAEGLVENEMFTGFKRALGEALIEDVAATSAKARVAELASNKATFGDFAFAEAYDSLHCSAATAAKLHSDFPKVEPIIAEASREIDLGLAGNVLGGKLGLWGRWGGGNGPLRQGFSNWRSFRQSGGGVMNFRRFNSGGGLIGRRRIFGR